MKTIKNTMSITMVILIIISAMLFPTTAFANNSTVVYTEVHNPLTENAEDTVIEKAPFYAFYSANSLYDARIYDNPVDAAKALRDGIVKREKTISVKYYYPNEYDDSNKTGISLAGKLFNMSISEELSSCSVDGDYLKYICTGYRSNNTKTVSGDGRNCYASTYILKYRTTLEEEQELTNKINADIAKLKLDEKNDYLKIKSIHDYICENARYDYVTLDDETNGYKYTAYGLLVQGYGVCAGYATLFTRLCKENGLEARTIEGRNHAWNIVKLGDLFYNVDVTWDDGTDDNPNDPNGNYWGDEYSDYWLLRGSADFYQHKPIDEYAEESFWEKYPLAERKSNCNHKQSYISMPDNASCIEGFVAYERCKNCDIKLSKKTIDANSTHVIKDITILPGCESKGYDLHKCINCRYEYKDNYVDSVGHKPATAVKEKVKKATCTTAGSYDSVVYCAVCKHELNRTKKTVAKLGHNYKITTTKATQTADGKIVKKCSKCNHVASTTVIPKASSITISTTKYTYDGNYKKSTVTVKDRKGNKLSTANYSVAYSNNRYVGKASVKVTLKGNYSGTKTLYYTINPKGTTLSTLSATSKGFKVTWKKQSTQTTGYQIQYATNSNFDNAKTVTVTSNSTTSKTISKLYAKKRYYVRVRTYKIVNGTKYYSAWSGYKYVTTKV